MPTTNPLPGAATYYAQSGWKILPCHGLDEFGKCTCGKTHADPKDIGKHAAVSEWQNAATDDVNMVDSWWRVNERYNIGVMCRASGFFVLDIDPRSGGFESFDRLEELVDGDIPDTVTAITGSYHTPRSGQVRGKHLYFKAPAGIELLGKIKDLPGIDIKHNGYVLLAPSNHLSGVTYTWAPGHAPWEIALAEPSEKLLALITKRKGKVGVGGSWDFVNDLSWGGDKLDLEEFFKEGISEGSRAVDLYKMTCALANKFGTDTAGREATISTMQKFNHEMVSPPLDVDDLMGHVLRAIEFVANNPKSELAGRGALGSSHQERVDFVANLSPNYAVMEPDFETAEYDEDYVEPARSIMANVSVSKDVDAIADEDGGAMGERTLTDTGNGRRLVDVFGETIRYTPGLGWFHWNTEYWKPDVEELSVRELTKRLASVIGAESARVQDPDEQKAIFTWAKQAKSNARQAAAIESAASDPRVAVPVDRWDSDPYLLGVANGVVDLRTGDLLRGRPDLHITRRTSTAYLPGRSDKRFEDFLNYATYGDKELQDWIQKAAGYTLTGLRTYDIFFIVYGPPGSGKNVLVESLVKALDTKQYAFPLDSMILAQGDGRSNATDQYHWAEMRGRRMIWVDELPESERLKENAVKKLTGSSEISARSPGEKPFTFESQGKLWITTNHRPIITDEAMWRRIRPIPWMNVPEVPDPTLKAYLHDPEGGLPAVLAWAVEGAMKLLASKELDALGWCAAVKDAAEVYRRNEDRMGMFLEEETEQDVVSNVPIKTLFLVYQAWSEDRGEKPMSQIAFTRKLQDRGLSITGTGGRAVVLGYRTKPPKPSSEIDWDFAQRIARD